MTDEKPPWQEINERRKIVVVNKFSPRQCAEQIIAEHKGNIFSDQTKTIWAYNAKKGIWETAELQIRQTLRKELLGEEILKRHCVEEIIADIKELLYRPRPAEPNWKLICLQNGIWNIDAKQIQPHTPEHFFIQQIPHEYNTAKDNPEKIHKLFTDWQEDTTTLYELAAYCLIRAYPYQKLFFAIGSGANGKTKYAAILTMLTGEENVSHRSVEDLVSNRFAPADLHGKLLNISPEVNVEKLDHTSRLKQLCGEDEFMAERKYAQPFKFKNYAKELILTNDVPRTADRTQGFYRRFYPMPFARKFTTNANRTLLDGITKEDLQNLLGHLLAKTLPVLVEKGFAFTTDPSIEKLEEQYENYSNPLRQFLKECIVSAPDLAIPKWVFAELFNGWTRKTGKRVWGEKEISMEMISLSYETVKPQFTNKEGKLVQWNSWGGYGLNPNSDYIQHIQHIDGFPITSLHVRGSCEKTVNIPTITDIDVLNILKQLENTHKTPPSLHQIAEHLKDNQRVSPDQILQSLDRLKSKGDVFEVRPDFWKALE